MKFLSKELWTIGENPPVTIGSFVYVIVAAVGIWFIYKWIKKFARSAVKSGRLDTGREFAVTRILKYIFILVFISIALIAFNVNWTGFLALTPLLIGIGLGLQQVTNDIISGLILLMEPSIRVNDIVEVDDTVAKVTEIGLRTSMVESRNGVTMIIPNHKLVSEKLINWTTSDAVSRFIVKIGVAYGTDVQLVKKLLIETAWKHPKVITNPAPMVLFHDFGESSLDFELVFWSNQLFPIEEVKSDLRFNIDAAFRDNNISIPFPQRDVHMIPPSP